MPEQPYEVTAAARFEHLIVPAGGTFTFTVGGGAGGSGGGVGSNDPVGFPVVNVTAYAGGGGGAGGVGATRWATLPPDAGRCGITWPTPPRLAADHYHDEATRGLLAEAFAAQHAADLRREAEWMQTRNAAWERARDLLESWLSPQQLADYHNRDYFEVTSNLGNVWRIFTDGQTGNVVRMDQPDGWGSQWCAHPPGGLPDADAWLAQMLTLETDEDAFLAVANRFGVCGFGLDPHAELMSAWVQTAGGRGNPSARRWLVYRAPVQVDFPRPPCYQMGTSEAWVHVEPSCRCNNRA